MEIIMLDLESEIEMVFIDLFIFLLCLLQS